MNPRVLYNQSTSPAPFNRTIPAITATSELCKMAGVWSIKPAELIFPPFFWILQILTRACQTRSPNSHNCPYRLGPLYVQFNLETDYYGTAVISHFWRDKKNLCSFIDFARQANENRICGRVEDGYYRKKREGWCEVDVCSADWCEKNAPYPKHTKGRRLEESVHTTHALHTQSKMWVSTGGQVSIVRRPCSSEIVILCAFKVKEEKKSRESSYE